jgi:hypothetical protein
MKKSDFPETCASCRLATREKLRAELEGLSVKITEEYKIEERKAKKGKGKGKKVTAAAIEVQKPPVNNKAMRFQDYF